MGVKGSREEGGDFAVSNGPQCGAHAGEGLSDRDFTSPDIPVKEVTSSPPNENSGSDFSPQFSYQLSGEGGGQSPLHTSEEAHSCVNLLRSPIRRAGRWSPPPSPPSSCCSWLVESHNLVAVGQSEKRWE